MGALLQDHSNRRKYSCSRYMQGSRAKPAWHRSTLTQSMYRGQRAQHHTTIQYAVWCWSGPPQLCANTRRIHVCHALLYTGDLQSRCASQLPCLVSRHTKQKTLTPHAAVAHDGETSHTLVKTHRSKVKHKHKHAHQSTPKSRSEQDAESHLAGGPHARHHGPHQPGVLVQLQRAVADRTPAVQAAAPVPDGSVAAAPDRLHASTHKYQHQ